MGRPRTGDATDDELLEQVQLLANALGRTPTTDEWDDCEGTSPTSRAIEYRFGTWNAFVEEAGLEPRESGRRNPLQDFIERGGTPDDLGLSPIGERRSST